MKQLLTFVCDAPDENSRKMAFYQCACGSEVFKTRKDSVTTGRRTSCGCQTKDGRKQNKQSKHPLYQIWAVHHAKNFPDFELFVAELGPPPFEGATVGPLKKGTKASPGNVGWCRPIFTHGNDTIDQELFMPLDQKEFGKYNIEAYKEETDPTSWTFSLNQLTKQYDELRLKYEDDPVTLQRELEKLSFTEAIDKFDKAEAKAAKNGRSNQSSIWSQFRQHLLPIVTERMTLIHKSALGTNSGIHRKTINPVLVSGLINADEMALIGLNVILDCLGDGTGYRTPLTTVFKTIGQRIDDQCYLKWWEENHNSDFKYVEKWILDSNSGYHKKMRKAAYWFEQKVPDAAAASYKKLSQTQGDEALVHLGEWVFSAIQSCTCWFKEELLWDPFVDKKNKKHKAYYLGLSVEGMRWRNLIDQGIKELLFEAQPMVVDPIPWDESNPKNNHGGYLSPKPLSFSKLIHNCKGTKPSAQAIRSLNTVQSVGYKINDFMYHTLAALLGTNTKIGKFVCHERNQFMELNFPDVDPTVWTKEKSDPEFKKAKALISRAHSKCIANEQLQDVPFRCLKTAAKFLNYERIYFPCYFDNRLRIYYLHTSGLSPQGANYAKSLLLFADPLVVTDDNRDEVKRDLLISIANCFGNDKISLDDRVTFAEELVVQHEYVAKEPLSAGAFAAWSGCSEPFTYLATLRQYHEIFTWKTRNTTDIPCGRDAASSGLQLMGALLREKKAMTYTNVIPGDKPADLYAHVAHHAKALLNNANWMADQLEKRLENAQKKAEKTGKELKQEYFEFDLDSENLQRSTTKRAVMTDSYNASWLSKNEYVSDELEKLEEELGRKVTLAEKAIVTNAIVQGQDQGFPVCKIIKKFFAQVVSDVIGTQEKNLITWTTPCGSQMEQRYNKKQVKQIRTHAMGTASVYIPKTTRTKDGFITLSILKDTNEVAQSRHALSFSPNVHHSYDAYICQQAVLRAGTEVIATCHDCFYMRPGEVERALVGTREAFYDLVTSTVLQDLLDINEVDSVLIPRFGDDNLLDQCKTSPYMFH